MNQLITVRKNAYYDSVTLMTLSSKLKKREGVHDAVVSMGTPMNIELLQNIGLYNDEVAAAGPGDLLIAIRADSQDTCREAAGQVDVLLAGRDDDGSAKVRSYHTIAEAKRDQPGLNVAVISVAGQYAAREARLALNNGMHVMLFSDNVSVEEELALKQQAHEQGLLVMGPDCGTAILGGVGLCFANRVRRGSIGLVAASGTGLQEVSALIHRLGGGISQAIGTGGRDLSVEIGGLMMLDALRLLEEDGDTKVITLISKPPKAEVAQRVLEEVGRCKKPVVICFIGSGGDETGKGISFALSLEDAAAQAVELEQGRAPASRARSRYGVDQASASRAASALDGGQRYIRALYCGGTLASEALTTLADEGLPVCSNVAKKAEQKMTDPMRSHKNTIVDLGDDVFTQGRPHPMIEPELRNDRLVQEATDPETAVVLLDFELGYGSHADPAGVTLPAIRTAMEQNAKSGRQVAFVGYILGTDEDFQGYGAQRALLEDAGVILCQSNLHAVETALAIVKGRV